nr:hypothetical protein [Tanacetum cinerariifolium]
MNLEAMIEERRIFKCWFYHHTINGNQVAMSNRHQELTSQKQAAFGDPDREVPVFETFHEQTDEELTEKDIKQMEADDQAIQTILRSLPEDIYDAVDSCEIAQKIQLHVQQMMKGSAIEA